MRPKVGTSAHQTDRCAELVCSNSFRSDNPRNAVGLLKREMEALDSLVIRSARAAAVPAGDALAMDRGVFAQPRDGGHRLEARDPLVREEIREIPREGFVVIATGPLTSPALDARDRGAPRHRGPLLLRLDGADRRSLLARPLEDVRPLPLREGRRRGLLELPAHERGVRALPRRAPRGRDGAGQGLREGDLLRGLPADRGHGRARPRDAPPRADEADGPSRPAHGQDPVGRRAAAAGRSGPGALQPRRLPDEAEDPGAAEGLPDDPRPRERRVRALRDAPPQHVHPRAGAPRPVLADAAGAADLLRRADHRRRGLRRERGDGPRGGADPRAALRGPGAGAGPVHRRRSVRSRATAPSARRRRSSSR